VCNGDPAIRKRIPFCGGLGQSVLLVRFSLRRAEVDNNLENAVPFLLLVH
jgi:hypothetical protein